MSQDWIRGLRHYTIMVLEGAQSRMVSSLAQSTKILEKVIQSM